MVQIVNPSADDVGKGEQLGHLVTLHVAEAAHTRIRCGQSFNIYPTSEWHTAVV